MIQKTDYQFGKDIEFGELLDRYRMNTWTEEYFKIINPRIIDESKGVIPPNNDDTDVNYVCAYNIDRNGIGTIYFRNTLMKHIKF